MGKKKTKQAKVVNKLQKRVAKLTQQRRRVDQLSSEVEALREHTRRTAERAEAVADAAFAPEALSSDGARATDQPRRAEPASSDRKTGARTGGRTRNRAGASAGTRTR
jgi:hypothetical protein